MLCVKMFYYVTRSVYVSSSCHLFDGGPQFFDNNNNILCLRLRKHYSPSRGASVMPLVGTRSPESDQEAALLDA